MHLSVSLTTSTQETYDVYLDVDPDSPVSKVRGALERTTGAAGRLRVGGALIDDDAVISDTPVREGAMLTFDCDDPTFEPQTRGWMLHVVSGRDTGAVLPLPVGSHEMGRTAPLSLRDTSVSRRHALLEVTTSGATICDLGSSNGSTVDGAPVPKEADEDRVPMAVRPGQMITLGDTVLTIVAAQLPDAALEPGDDGTTGFNRPPRMLPVSQQVRIALPREPQSSAPRKIPIVGMFAPLVLGLVMYLFLKQIIYLLFCLMSPLMLVANAVSERRSSRKGTKEERAAYEKQLAEVNEQLRVALRAETAQRRVDAPDAPAVLLAATGPNKRLWERRRLDTDSLLLRVGTADQPSHLETADSSLGSDRAAGHRTVYCVPATVALRDAGVLGVAGPADDARGLVRWMVVQLAVLHAPRDVSLTLLCPRSERSWEWLRWLPHSRPGEIDGPLVSIGNDPETVTARVNELVGLLKARKDATRGVRPEQGVFSAHIVVLDGARSLRSVPSLAQVLQDGPGYGIYAICLEGEERLLPEECSASLVLSDDDPAHLVLRRSGFHELAGVLAEQVSIEYASTVARAIAPILDVSHDEDEVTLPDSARLLDVLSMEPPSPHAVRAHWQLGGKTTRMPLGVGTSGQFVLDLRVDGPHGLIAGTTGSGKSELLQTMVASLAVANRPDSMNFVLVDYKGGSAFKDCVRLPHTVGMVTDLDAHLVERALTSLSAELKRREHQLSRHDVKDLEDYDDLAARQPGLSPMPRLVIVIDEFASMARELPDFVTGLVNVAQRGRSLGIHLLLATQRPSGVVSADIRANTNLRISLRVTDAADSTDVLEASDAARLPKSAPGRGFARLGAGALLPFQSGRVGGRRPGVRAAHTPPPFVAELGWGQLGYPAPLPPVTAATEDAELTDLSVLVEAICMAAAEEGLTEQRTPWLPALTESLLLSALSIEPDDSVVLAPLVYGLQDLPAEQEQEPAALDLRLDGHLLAIGAPRSGRSQLLRTLATSAAGAHSCADLHVFGIDCGNGALLPLSQLPHCGAIVSRTQTERAARLLGRIAVELERRQGLLADGGFADISEQRMAAPAADRLPHLLLLIDRWEGFTSTLGELDGGLLQDTVMTVLREGASVGVHAVITGDRSLGQGRISSLTESRIAFRMADRGDFSLVSLNQRSLPDQIAPGRAFRAETGTEMQVALLSDDASGPGQAAAIAAMAEVTRDRDRDVPTSGRPFRVDILPSSITFEDTIALADAPLRPLQAIVGVGGDELSAVVVDLSRAPAFIVAGPQRSGRSTALLAMARSLLSVGTRVLVLAPRPSRLHELKGLEGVVDVVTDPTTPSERWVELLSGEGPLVVVVDDGESLRDIPAGDHFSSIAKGLVPGQALILGGNADGLCPGLSGWQIEAKKSRAGMLLSPQNMMDGDLIGVRVPRGAIGGAVVAGRGLVHRGDAALMLVAIPGSLQFGE